MVGKNVLIPKSARLDVQLVKDCEKKIKKDRENKRLVTWRSIFETGMRQYLAER